MCLVYSRKSRYKIKIFLSFFIFPSIIILVNNNLLAQGEKQRDPFLSLGDNLKLSQKQEDFSVLPYPVILNGIIWAENLPVAIINNEIVQEKEMWRDFKVEKIAKDKVILKRGESQFEIPLAGQEEMAGEDAGKTD